MAAGGIEAVEASSAPAVTPLDVLAMAKPEATGHAEMLQGSVRDVAEELADVLAARGLI
jgi:hypothetical protein